MAYWLPGLLLAQILGLLAADRGVVGGATASVVAGLAWAGAMLAGRRGLRLALAGLCVAASAAFHLQDPLAGGARAPDLDGPRDVTLQAQVARVRATRDGSLLDLARATPVDPPDAPIPARLQLRVDEADPNEDIRRLHEQAHDNIYSYPVEDDHDD